MYSFILQLLGDAMKGSHAGGPVPSVEIKLVSIPDMEYLVTDDPPRGEILIRGASISQGYYKDEKKTKEDFEENGWFHTGDVGTWAPNGTLRIIDRKKNIFKLSQGEVGHPVECAAPFFSFRAEEIFLSFSSAQYVAAEKVELILATSRFTSQVWIYGDSYKDCLVAIAALDPLYMADYSKKNGTKAYNFETVTDEELNEDKDLVKAVLTDMNQIGRDAKLHGFELPKGTKMKLS